MGLRRAWGMFKEHGANECALLTWHVLLCELVQAWVNSREGAAMTNERQSGMASGRYQNGNVRVVM